MKLGAEPAQITPASGGWRLHHGAAPPREAPSLEELRPLLPAGVPVELALPCFAVILQRLTLPSTEREELSGMIQLHLEKTLPYPIEEVTSDFVEVRRGTAETTALAVAVHGPGLTKLCQPLRTAERLPEFVSLFALDVAPHLPSGGVVAAVWAEQGHLAVGLYEGGVLSWADNLIGLDAETVATDLPSLLLTAEMEGVPVRVEAAVVASDCVHLREVLGGVFRVPIGVLAVEEVRPRRQIQLEPPDWALAAQRQARTENLRQRLLLGAMAYLLLVACAFVYLAWTKRQVQILEAQIARVQPALLAMQARAVRWQALAPALVPSQYPVEVLFLVNRNRPAEVHITLFEVTPAQFKVEGEAPNPGLAIDFTEKLRADHDLASYSIESAPPSILPKGDAQFRIFGNARGLASVPSSEAKP